MNMTSRELALLILFIISMITSHGSSSKPLAEPCVGPTCGKIFYFNPARTEYGSFNEKFWITGPVYPEHILAEQENGLVSFEGVMVSLHSCENGSFHCISGLGTVFAVPKSRLTPSAEYPIL